MLKASGHKPLNIGANTKLAKLDNAADGNVILIRFIRSHRVFNIFREKFKVSKDLIYSSLTAVIVAKIHRLQLYLGEELVPAFDYHLTITQ